MTAMAAHNPLAARLAQDAGFGAIWGSGFELSASYAVPDANILSMGTHQTMRAIASTVDIPLIAVFAQPGLATRSMSATSFRSTRRLVPVRL